jgi:hypothetical protein
MQPARDFEMQHEPKLSLHSESDLLAQAPHLVDRSAFGCANRGAGRAQQKRGSYQYPDESVTDDASSQRFHINRDIR